MKKKKRKKNNVVDDPFLPVGQFNSETRNQNEWRRLLDFGFVEFGFGFMVSWNWVLDFLAPSPSHMEKEQGKNRTASNNALKVKKRDHECSEDSGCGIEFLKDEDLDQISELKRGSGFIEMRCGCTSPKYGDAVGRLRIYVQGDFKVICECSPGCGEGELSPSAFERHAGREKARKWKNNIWIIIGGQKVPLSKTMLLKCYNKAPRNGRGHHKGHTRQSYHRDEFVRCTKCNKERRFRLRNKEECRIYHDACANMNWECADLPYDKITCEEEEERVSRKAHKGCPNFAACEGCTSCVCFGCDICRFRDCSCQTCVDFTSNAKA